MADFKDLQSAAGLGELNNYLASRSYIEGYAASARDAEVFAQVGNVVDSSKFPHVFRWYNHIAALVARNVVALKPNPALFAGSGSGASKKAAAAPKPASPKAKPASPKAKPASPKAKPAKKPADDDDDDDIQIDLSDDEDGPGESAKEVAERLKKQKEEAENTKKKNAPVAKSSVILDISPCEAETDLGQLEAFIRSIQKEGLVWGACDKIPVAYGVKKLRIIATVVDDLVSVDELQEEIEAEEELCQSTTIFAFNKI